MAIDPSAVWDFAREVVGVVRPDRGRTLATVTRIDPDGTTWVTTGDGGEAPASSVAAGVSVGDTVALEWDGASMGIRSNVTNPSPAGSVIRRAVERTRSVADAAQKVADAVNQHFFADGHGIHVTEATQEDWDANHAGPNVLINSIGQLFRDGLNNLLTLTTEGGARALTVWDGLGNAASNVRAIIGETIQLGNAATGATLALDRDSMDMKRGSTTMMHIGITEQTSSGSTTLIPNYTMGMRKANSTIGNYSMAEGENNTASGLASHAEGQNTTASKLTAHAEGYQTTASGDFSHAEGNKTTASGNYSHAEGDSATASGSYSHAQNRGTIAASGDQTAIGKWNKSDTANKYALIIGNGSSNTSRSNALDVDWSGNVECNNVGCNNLANKGTVNIYSSFTTSSVTILEDASFTANGALNGTVNIPNQSNLKPLALVGWTSNSRYTSMARLYLNQTSTGGTINYFIYNTRAAALTATISVVILWARA